MDCSICGGEDIAKPAGVCDKCTAENSPAEVFRHSRMNRAERQRAIVNARAKNKKLIAPPEVLTSSSWARNLTVDVGASAKMAFDRSARMNTGGIMDAASRFAEHLDEWPAMTKEIFAHLYDDEALKPIADDKKSKIGMEAIASLKKQPAFDMLQAASSAHRAIAAESGAEVSKVIGKAMGLERLSAASVESISPEEAASTAETLAEMMRDAGATEEQVKEATKESEAIAAKSARHRWQTGRNMQSSLSSREFKNKLKEIAEKASEKAEAVAMMRGFGLGAGGSESGDEGIDEELMRMLSENPGMIAVLRECGRLRESLSAKGLATASEGRCDVVGVEPSDDATRAMPEELALLDDPEMGDYAMSRLVQGEMMSWKMEGDEHKDSGDIVLLVDRSGSMGGATMVFARSLAASILMTARKAKRRVVLCMFDHTFEVAATTATGGMKDALKKLGLPASGGTDVAGAMRAVLDRGFADLRDPDVLLITDGSFRDREIEKQVARFPGDTRFSALMLNGGWHQEHEWLSQKWSIEVSEKAGSSDALVEILSNVGRKGKVSEAQSKVVDAYTPF